MTKREIRADLTDIRYYYTHKPMFDRAENTGFKNTVVKKTEKDNLYAAMDVAAVWLERALSST